MPPKSKRTFDLTIYKASGEVTIKGIEANKIDTDDGGRVKFIHPETGKRCIFWGPSWDLIESDGIGTNPGEHEGDKE